MSKELKQFKWFETACTCFCFWFETNLELIKPKPKYNKMMRFKEIDRLDIWFVIWRSKINR